MRLRIRTVTVLAIFVSLLALTAPGADASPRSRTATIKAVVVRSWGQCSGTDLVWDDLNAEWPFYGTIPITIDYSDPSLCNVPVTYDALVASGADVMILSDPGGTVVVYSQAEIDAIHRYAMDGHNIIGTYILFGNPGTPNGELAPLFGFKELDYGGTVPIVRPYRELVPSSPLFRHIPNPYRTEGYLFTQITPDGAWSANESIGAKYQAITGVGAACISVFAGNNYRAIHISSMPEYQGGVVDEQFLYNAITFP